MTELGSGSFTVAYRLKSGMVRLVSVDPIKEDMANGCLPKHRMFPKVSHYKTRRETKKKRYTMPFYDVISSYDHLKNSLNYRQREFFEFLCDNMKLVNGVKAIRYRLNNFPDKWKYEKEVILEAVKGLEKYDDDLCFEIATVNLAVKNEQLILLDCFFLRSVLNEIRNW